MENQEEYIQLSDGVKIKKDLFIKTMMDLLEKDPKSLGIPVKYKQQLVGYTKTDSNERIFLAFTSEDPELKDMFKSQPLSISSKKSDDN